MLVELSMRRRENTAFTRRELAALIFGLKQFRPYLLGRHFQVRVDNMAIRYYKNMKDTSGQCARYLDFLSNFDFDIVYREGGRHVNCDSLSRLRPCEIDNGGLVPNVIGVSRDNILSRRYKLGTGVGVRLVAALMARLQSAMVGFQHQMTIQRSMDRRALLFILMTFRRYLR